MHIQWGIMLDVSTSFDKINFYGHARAAEFGVEDDGAIRDTRVAAPRHDPLRDAAQDSRSGDVRSVERVLALGWPGSATGNLERSP